MNVFIQISFLIQGLACRAVGRADPILNSGKHVSPIEFHEMLEGYSEKLLSSESCSDKPGAPIVLVDVRNRYETRIGEAENRHYVL